MSSSTPGQTTTPPDFKSILDAALTEYKEKTGKELLNHPLATEVQGCDSVDAIKAIFQGQAKAFQQFRDGDQRLMKWISPVVDILYRFSGTLGEVAGQAFTPAGVIFTGIGILLAAAKDVKSSHDALIELFERIENFFERLGVYIQMSLIAEMAEVFVKIVAEILSILSIATKEVKRKRAKIYFRKLLGRTDIEDALRKLDSLIEEVRMVIAETRKDVEKLKWNQIVQDVRKWFSPSDPSTNHNTACDVYHNAPPMWVFEAGVFKDWMSDGSLLWIHGKPGSGKSILCSAIIQHIIKLRDAGSATLAYFYFDFRDDQKQDVRDLVTSLLVQLSAYSKPCCNIIYQLYLAHGKGAQQPSNGILINHLKEMLMVAGQHPIFIILDALDECPDDGLPNLREAVLNFVMDLARLQIPNLHICTTSRPEVNIQTILEPIAVHAISLHEETGQKFVIANYVSSVVSSDVHMVNWRDEDKRLVVEQLSDRADGMFQLVVYQLEMLRRAVQPDVRAILERLPKTLDETYKRVLKGIDENNRDHACRLLHCLAVSVRPLRVEELAEILTFDFDTARGGIPKFHPDRRPEDREKAVLSICSSLVTVVNTRDSRVVQFSHLSVKEFLTSDHLAHSTGHLTPDHIIPGQAHTILAQVCLGFLLHLDDRDDNNGVKGSPLAEYAARHWVTHAQFDGVAPRMEDGMRALFDLDRPHFAAWIGLYDIDAESGGKFPSEIASPLYYSALCGFHDLVRHLAIKYPQHINAIGGFYGFPLVAALCRNHVPVAELLLEHGGNVDVRDGRKQTALHKTVDRHDKLAIGAVQFLLGRGADVNARRDDLWTPLHLAANAGELLVAQMLLDHQADVNSRNVDGQTPLHLLSRRQISQDEDNCCDIAKLLLTRGANVNEKDEDKATPLHLASYNKRLDIVQVLLNHRANADAENDQGETPLQIVLRDNHNTQDDGVGIVRLLLEHGAEAYARDKYRISTSDLACCFGREKIGQALGDGKFFKPENNRDQSAFRLWVEECNVDRNVQDKYDAILLHLASYHGRPEMARMLLNHGVKSNAKNHRGETALHVVSRGRYDSNDGVRVAVLLLERGIDVNAQDNDRDSPLHSASYNGKLEIARVLLDHDAKVSAKNDKSEIPLHQVSQGEYESQADGVGIAQLLLDRGVDVNARDKNGVTPLHLASWCGKLEVARLFLEQASSNNDRVGTLLDSGQMVRPVDLNAQQKDLETPLHFACFRGKPEITRLLLDHGVNVNARNDQGEIPLHRVSRGEYDSPDDGVRVAELLLESDTDVNAQDKIGWTPLHSASYNGRLEISQVLLHHGAKVDAENNMGETPLHLVQHGKLGPQDGIRIAQLLLNGGVDVNSRDKRDWTPLHAASYYGRLEVAQALLGRGAIAKAEDNEGKTPLHQVSQGNFESKVDGVHVAQLLLDRGVDVNAQDKKHATALHLASWCGRVEIVRVLLGQAIVKNSPSRTPSHLGLEGRAADVNTVDENDWNPLHCACHSGKLEIARLLLDHGAKVDAVDMYDGKTPLHLVSQGKCASEEASISVACLLLERGGDINARCDDLQTPLHIASLNGKLEIARFLLDNGAKVDAVTGFGGTPLHHVSEGICASEEASISVARLLLERGGDINARREDLQTPFHIALSNGKLEIARFLLDNGAKFDVVTRSGGTPLHLVSQGKCDSEKASISVARLLLERGGDINARCKDLKTPLHIALSNGKLDIARFLLDNGAKADAVDWYGNIPLHHVSKIGYASEEASVSVARLLLERGGDINARCKDLQTPLYIALSDGKLEIARFLLDNGAMADAVDMYGNTPLHCVSTRRYASGTEEASVSVARLLLERGGDINARCKDLQTPLHIALSDGNLEIARFLLDNGAMADAVGMYGNTPLHCVSTRRHTSGTEEALEEASVSVARLLLERGGDINARRKDLRTPLHIALSDGNLEIARFLLDNGANVVPVDRYGETPLHQVSKGRYASEEASISVARILLERGGDINARRKDLQTPLHFALSDGKLEIARFLLDNGAMADAVDKYGNTPLHCVLTRLYAPEPQLIQLCSLNTNDNTSVPVTEEASVGVARLLLERGGKINARRKDLQTPFHIALSKGKLEIARFLLDNGAKVDAVTRSGDTPLHLVSQGKGASEEASISIARLLLERGGDINARRKDLQTPLHIALHKENLKLEIARFLLDHGAEVDAVDSNKFGDTPLHGVSREFRVYSGDTGIRVARLLLDHGADLNAKARDRKTPLKLSASWPELAQLLHQYDTRPKPSSSWTSCFKSSNR